MSRGVRVDAEKLSSPTSGMACNKQQVGQTNQRKESKVSLQNLSTVITPKQVKMLIVSKKDPDVITHENPNKDCH